MSSSNKAVDGDVRDEIMRTAADLFMERGFGGTKVVDIARAVGLTPASLYWHFPSKEDILFEYLERSFTEFNERIAEATKGIDDPVERLRVMAREHTAAQLEFREQAQTLLAVTHSTAQLLLALPADRHRRITELLRVHVQRTRQTVRDGVEAGVFLTPDINALTFAVVNVCEYSVLWFRPDGEVTAARMAATNAELVVRMATGAPDENGGVA